MTGGTGALDYNMLTIQEDVGLVVGFLTLLWLFRKLCDPVILLTYGYFVIANFQKLVVMVPPPEMPLDYFMTLGGSISVRPLALINLFFLLFIFMPLKWVRPIMYTMCVILFLDLDWLFFHPFGIMSAMSFDTAVAALLLPWLFANMEKKEKFTPSFILFCYLFFPLFFLKGRTALLTISIMNAAFCVHRKYWKILSVATVITLVYVYLWGPDFFDPNGRVFAVKAHFKWWVHSVEPYFGLGLGGMHLVGPWIPVNTVRYVLMHNDFLQVFFETGLVGLLVFLILVGRVYYKAYKHSTMAFIFCTGFLVVMNLYFPIHFFLSNLILLLYMKLIFYGPSEKAKEIK